MFAEPCSHISRLFENIWLGACYIGTDVKSTQTTISVNVLRLMSKDIVDSIY